MSVECARFSVAEYPLENVPADVWSAWDACVDRWSLLPFQTPTWLRSCAAVMGGGASSRLLIARGDDGSPVGLWPYRVERTRSGGLLPLTLCRPWNDEIRSSTWLLMAPDAGPDLCVSLAEAFLDRIPRWDKMLTGQVPAGSPLLAAQEAVLQRRKARALPEEWTTGELRGGRGFDEFLKSLAYGWRRKYAKLAKQMAAGEIRVEHVTRFEEPAALETVKRRMRDVYAESWKVDSDETYANLLHPKGWAAFSAVIEAFAARGGLHVVLASAGGRDVAFYVGVSQGSQYCSLHTAYRQSSRNLSAGVLVQMEDYRYTLEHGLTNCFMGFQAYREHFTEDTRTFVSKTVYARTATGRLALVLSDLKERLEKNRRKKRTAGQREADAANADA
jgi:hypothetical protein